MSVKRGVLFRKGGFQPVERSASALPWSFTTYEARHHLPEQAKRFHEGECVGIDASRPAHQNAQPLN